MTLTRRNFGLLVATLAAAPLLAAKRAHAAPTLDEALAKVNTAREGLKTVVGPFTQERTIGLLSAKVKSEGTMTLVRPDRLRWELAAPDSVIYWVGPEGLAYKSARGQGRVPPTQARIAAALEDLRLVLAGDLGKLKERYDLSLVATDGGADLAFSAVPKDPAAKLKRIDFALDPTGALPKRVVLIEGAKDKTEIVFGNLTRDTAVDMAIVKPPV